MCIRTLRPSGSLHSTALKRKWSRAKWSLRAKLSVMVGVDVKNAILVFAFLLVGAVTGADAEAQSDKGGGADAGPVPIATFTKGLTPQRGLFTLWRKGGKVYIELAPEQLDADFIQTAVPGSGIGGFGITPGLPYLQFPSARIVRMSHVDDKIVVKWPNTSFVAEDGTSAARAIAASVAPSVIATAPVVAIDPAPGGHLIFDASYLLGDTLDIADALRLGLDTDKKPGSAYHLDDTRTYFGPSKAFADNVIVQANQTWTSAAPPDQFDSVIDARSLEIDIKYNIVRAPALGTYMPRYADDRVGYYPNIQLQFGDDSARERQVRQIARWNIARHPMVYYISNTVPEQYRDTIKSALLTWNDAFAKIGYPNAVEVRDQPSDPAWDPDDVNNNVVHWLTQAYGGGYAQAGLVFDPRTGEMIHTSIVLDADLVRFGYREGYDFTGPIAGADSAGRSQSHEAAYAAGAHASAAFGLAALRAFGALGEDEAPPNYVQDFLRSIVLHESGHNWGLQHNFIASEAYSAQDVRSKAFTEKFGLANSVMEYTPTNIWPKGMSTGDYFQTVLGPYDYYAIKWGYAPVPGATTPAAEVPALSKIASAWSDPKYRFAMDEDVQYENGHAIDPRVAQFDLTNDSLGWCDSQLTISNTLMHKIEGRFTRAGDTHDPLRDSFYMALSPIATCSIIATHYIGGEELSRAHIGDPGAAMPLSPTSRAQSQRAFALLDAQLFKPDVMPIAPSLLRKMVYTEWVTDLPSPGWAYAPPLRHDVPVAQIVENLQRGVLSRMFNPVVLQRLDDAPAKYPHGEAMCLPDVFAWTQAAVFGDLSDGRIVEANEIHRALQQYYARMLAQMLLAPAPALPYDAQSLARTELVALAHDVQKARGMRSLDLMTRSHLDALDAVAHDALAARTVVPVQKAAAPE